MSKDSSEGNLMSDPRLGGLDPEDEEFVSVESFVEYLLDEERDTFTHFELMTLWASTGWLTHKLRKDLEGYGVTLEARPKERKFRGFTTSSHDRWYGPGSSPSHGGSGWAQIIGMSD